MGIVDHIKQLIDPEEIELLREEARAALQRIEARSSEDLDTWATNLGNDLGSFHD